MDYILSFTCRNAFFRIFILYRIASKILCSRHLHISIRNSCLCLWIYYVLDCFYCDYSWFKKQIIKKHRRRIELLKIRLLYSNLLQDLTAGERSTIVPPVHRSHLLFKGVLVYKTLSFFRFYI